MLCCGLGHRRLANLAEAGHTGLDALAHPLRGPIGLWRNPGDDLEIATSEHCVRPTQTKALTCTVGNVNRSAAFQGLIRDEEAARSKPSPSSPQTVSITSACEMKGADTVTELEEH